MFTSKELSALSMQDWLLRRAGYRPSQVKDIDVCSEQFYTARWRNKDISGYWRKLSESRVKQELHVKDYVPIEV
jgi:hypothetical protein